MDKIGICGGGLIGASWALGFSSNKYKVFVYDNSKKVREEFLDTVKSLHEDLLIIKEISFNEIKSNICYLIGCPQPGEGEKRIPRMNALGAPEF